MMAGLLRLSVTNDGIFRRFVQILLTLYSHNLEEFPGTVTSDSRSNIANIVNNLNKFTNSDTINPPHPEAPGLTLGKRALD
jgi:hypothetical protein